MTTPAPPPPGESDTFPDLAAEYPQWEGWRTLTGIAVAWRRGTGLVVRGMDWATVRSEVARIEAERKPPL